MDTGEVMGERALQMFERQVTNGLERAELVELDDENADSAAWSEAESERPTEEPELPTEKKRGRKGKAQKGAE